MLRYQSLYSASPTTLSFGWEPEAAAGGTLHPLYKCGVQAERA